MAGRVVVMLICCNPIKKYKISGLYHFYKMLLMPLSGAGLLYSFIVESGLPEEMNILSPDQIFLVRHILLNSYTNLCKYNTNTKPCRRILK